MAALEADWPTMLVFFIHGVATHDVKYADKLKNLIKEEFDQQKKSRPIFTLVFGEMY